MQNLYQVPWFNTTAADGYTIRFTIQPGEPSIYQEIWQYT
jgi:hypothetical protein